MFQWQILLAESFKMKQQAIDLKIVYALGKYWNCDLTDKSFSVLFMDNN